MSRVKSRASLSPIHDACYGLAEAVETGVGVLKNHGVVAYPTDTLYGLGAAFNDLEAVERVFDIKGRPRNAALPLLVASHEDVEQVAVGLNPWAEILMEAFWPGPLTLVVPSAQATPYMVTGGKGTVAVRMPDHPVPQALVRGLGCPITGTSANPTGGSDPATAEDVRRALGDRVDCVIHGGPAPIGQPSTIIDLTGERPRLIRAGALTVEAIEEAISESVEAA
jgi:L-threonylcarbamoyladenylate synthase